MVITCGASPAVPHVNALTGPGRTLRFGTFELNLETGELRKQRRPVRLQEQPFQILAMLLERPGEMVTREQVREKLWRTDTFVDFDHGLNNAINRLREALGDSADTPRYIETLPRRGYRFVGAVEPIRPGAQGAGVAADRDRAPLG